MAAVLPGLLIAASGGAAALIAGKFVRNPQSVQVCVKQDDPVYIQILREAHEVEKQEPYLRTRLRNAVYKQSSVEGMLAHILANKLSSRNNKPEMLYELFKSILEDPESAEAGTPLSTHIREDILAVVQRDAACSGPLQVLFYFKGYHSLQAHRISHALWKRGRKWMALQIQSSISEAFAVDVHPAATIGRRVMVDHATGVVIGETARVGNDCSILHNVTLGASGKDLHDRHPKVGNGVLIGAGSMIIGNIYLGDNAKIGAGSVVLKSIPAGATAVGAPAKVVGRAKEQTPGTTMDMGLKSVQTKGSFDTLFPIPAQQREGYMTIRCIKKVLKERFTAEDIDRIFFELDNDHSGEVSFEKVKQNLAASIRKCQETYNGKGCQGCTEFKLKDGEDCVDVLAESLLKAVQNGSISPKAVKEEIMAKYDGESLHKM